MRDAVARQLENSTLVVNREWSAPFYKGVTMRPDV